MNRFLALLGQTNDERIVTLVALILCAVLPLLAAHIIGGLPVAQ